MVGPAPLVGGRLGPAQSYHATALPLGLQHFRLRSCCCFGSRLSELLRHVHVPTTKRVSTQLGDQYVANRSLHWVLRCPELAVPCRCQTPAALLYPSAHVIDYFADDLTMLRAGIDLTSSVGRESRIVCMRDLCATSLNVGSACLTTIFSPTRTLYRVMTLIWLLCIV